MKLAKWQVRAGAEEAEVWIYDEIGENWWGEGISAKGFIDELNGLPSTVATIRVRLNSPGGDVFEGFAIYQALMRHRARVVIEIDALAASAASVVAMAGDTIRMADTSLVMVHDPWSYCLGSAEEMRAMAELLDQVTDSCLNAYARRPGVDRETIREAMRAETWYTASGAMDAGLVDEIIESPAAIAARIPPGRYRNAPAGLVAPVRTDPPRPQSAHARLAAAQRALQLAKH
jgi:ATP-dependent Clp protease, protease subunit